MTLLVKKLNLATVIAAATDLDLVARAEMSHHDGMFDDYDQVLSTGSSQT